MRFVFWAVAIIAGWLLAHDAAAQSAKADQTLPDLYKQFLQLYDQGNYRAAEPIAKQYLALAEKGQGPDGLDVGWGANNLGLVYRNLGQYPASLPLFERAAKIMDKLRGPDHLDTARVLRNLAWAQIWTGQAAAGERALRRVVDIRQAKLGRDDPLTADVVGDLASAVKGQGRYGEALTLEREALSRIETAAPNSLAHAVRLNNLGLLQTEMGQYRQANSSLEAALAIGRKLGAQGSEAEFGRTLSNIAWLRSREGRYRSAEEFYKRALELRGKIDGPDGVSATDTLSDLSILYVAQARYAEAERNYETIITRQVKAFGAESQQVATTINNRGILYFKQGRYGESDTDLNRALDIRQKILGKRHAEVASTLSSLGWLRFLQGKYQDSETFLRQAISIREQLLGPDHFDLGDALSDLAILYAAEGRYDEAEPLRKRFLALARKAYGERSVGVATAIVALANFYRDTDRLDEAVANGERALKLQTELLDASHPDVAATLETLGEVATLQRRYEASERLLAEASRIYRDAYSAGHPSLGDVGLKLGRLYLAQERYDLARLTLELALTEASKALEPSHPRLASIHDALAATHAAGGDYERALAASEKFAEIRRRRLEESVEELTGGMTSENRLARPGYIRLLDSAVRLREPGSTEKNTKLFDKALSAVQLLRSDATAGALARASARLASDDGPLAKVVRDRTRLVDLWRSLDRRLVEIDASPAQRSVQATGQLRARLSETAGQVAAIDRRLNQDYPQYVEIVRPQILSLERVRSLLVKDEALLLFAVGKQATFALAIGPGGQSIYRAEIESDRLRDLVNAVRSGVEPARTLPELAERGFDSTAAHELYSRLISPVANVLAGARHVMVVADDALQSFPLAILLSKPSTSEFRSFSQYRDAPWLGRDFAFTTLPSASSLQTLRHVVRPTRAEKPFIGFGDPMLHDAGRGGVRKRAGAQAFRGGRVDLDAIRALPSLPESAEEVRTIARILGADSASMFLGKAATETNVRKSGVGSSRVVLFATHGLLASETAMFGAAAEPALVLTPPRTPSEQDDGLLTASEIVRFLKLDADWVILSACNTAGPERDGAEGLSGLAKAFFYAGTRALLVSHWSVPSDSTTLLTSSAFAELERNPKLGRSEAMKRAMIALLGDNERPHFAHPIFWAAFVVVGEGGTAPAALR